MLLTALILNIVLLHTFVISFDYRITSGSLLLLQVKLYLYRHYVITSFTYCFCLGIILTLSSR